MAQSVAAIAHGPIFIGVMINTTLYGIMIMQTYLYFSYFKQDLLWIKILVVVIFLADTFNTVFDLVYLYDCLILNFDNPQYLATATWLVGTDPAITGIITLLVQGFFAWRVKVLTQNNWIVAFILTTAVSAFFGALGTAIGVAFVPDFAQFQRTKQVVIVWLVSSALGDIVITAALVTYLRRHRTGFAVTDSAINRLIRFTMQTGLLTAIVAILDLTFFLVETSGLYLLFNYPLCKIYTNSLMSSLNSRSGWDFNQADATGGNQTLSGIYSSQFHKAQPKVVVHIESHQIRATDWKPHHNPAFDIEAVNYAKSEDSF